MSDRSFSHHGTVLEIDAVDHPGTMSHIISLFTRRAYNVEGICCLPLPGGTTSRIWLKLCDRDPLPQIVAQLRKLEDVRAVACYEDEHPVFIMLDGFITEPRS